MKIFYAKKLNFQIKNLFYISLKLACLLKKTEKLNKN